ncbi:hypothetical protein GLAREA_07231 [Glarea lozoyensis ATCC 20868]|uniref:Uncharacterized protein n=1 Tax=Glarea lozoyensis (strain ATCC 20868 / MF5171) TaxID=1116229 RepID=S3E7B4_GLAL2|nr:uncharacterized protein GLAREA_07231 [Glarea lozoyensis ATCC 20868]EPE34218.1 hypothetical protein GLAREA_07231 [Glarea lozoyensis ATCC 20868]
MSKSAKENEQVRRSAFMAVDLTPTPAEYLSLAAQMLVVSHWTTVPQDDWPVESVYHQLSVFLPLEEERAEHLRRGSTPNNTWWLRRRYCHWRKLLGQVKARGNNDSDDFITMNWEDEIIGIKPFINS